MLRSTPSSIAIDKVAISRSPRNLSDAGHVWGRWRCAGEPAFAESGGARGSSAPLRRDRVLERARPRGAGVEPKSRSERRSIRSARSRRSRRAKRRAGGNRYDRAGAKNTLARRRAGGVVRYALGDERSLGLIGGIATLPRPGSTGKVLEAATTTCSAGLRERAWPRRSPSAMDRPAPEERDERHAGATTRLYPRRHCGRRRPRGYERWAAAENDVTEHAKRVLAGRALGDVATARTDLVSPPRGSCRSSRVEDGGRGGEIGTIQDHASARSAGACRLARSPRSVLPAGCPPRALRPGGFVGAVRANFGPMASTSGHRRPLLRPGL